MSIPFDIGRFLILPRRRLYGFLVTSKVMPGVLTKIASIPAMYNVIILYLCYSRLIPPGKTITALAFCDFTDSDITPEDLVKEMEKLEFIENIEIIKPKISGFIADNVSSPLKIRENRAIIIRDIGYKGLLVDIRKRFGSAAEAFLYYLGKEAGKEYGKDHLRIAEKTGLSGPFDIHDKISAQIFNSVGYGYMETIELTKTNPYSIIRVYNSFECELGINSDKPFSHLIRGMIAGVISVLLGLEMQAIENKCIAIGDPYCEFEIKPV